LEIRVAEELPVESVDALPDELPEQEYAEIPIDEPSSITGGRSFIEATAVEPGAYKGTIVPGEVQIFTVPADWGQQVSARLRIPPLSNRLAEEADTDFLAIRVYSPSRANATSVPLSDAHLVVQQEGDDGYAITSPIAYRNRTSINDQTSAASEAGDYYVVVSASPKAGASYQLPYELGIAVDGKVQGQPTYQAEPSASASASASPSAPESATASTGPTAGSTATSATPGAPPTGNATTDDDDRNPVLAAVGWTLGGLGAMAVIGGIVTAVILLRRRS
jgi:Ca-activated chloride channel family protein